MPSRYLTKSRFKLAMECATKLFYSGKSDLYADKTVDDEFLSALAQGGYQVGELAKLMFPGGIQVAEGTDEEQVEETAQLLQRDQVTIFEAAFTVRGLFAKVDILRKDGHQIELIEVKAKSYDPADMHQFVGKRGRLVAKMRPYLLDVAFQRYVVERALPGCVGRISCFLMLLDKSAVCTVDRLNQKFRVQRRGGRFSVQVAPGIDSKGIGAPILVKVPVGQYVNRLLNEPLTAPGVSGSFDEVVRRLAETYSADQRIPSEIGSHCGNCQFRNVGPNRCDELRSGLHECWQEHGISRDAFGQGTVLDLWSFERKNLLISEGRYLLRDVTEDDLKVTPEKGGLSVSERQWMQVSGQWEGRGPFYIDRDRIRDAMQSWRYPLHFIDFETARFAVPATVGRRPYANIAFQFSHHEVDEKGRVVHRSEFLDCRPGKNPNYDFVRALKAALDGDNGTIFQWSPYENSVLNNVLDELSSDANPPGDADELCRFLLSVTTRGADGCDRAGARAMVDLCRLAERWFFDPATKGGNSIKKVLPAVLRDSEYLRSTYSRPIYGAADGIPSLNWTTAKPQTWWTQVDGQVVNPYDVLPPIFDDLTASEMATIEFQGEMEIREGGSAMTAFGRLQFEDLPDATRMHIEMALKRYCELDTLAMVIVYEAWREWCR